LQLEVAEANASTVAVATASATADTADKAAAAARRVALCSLHKMLSVQHSQARLDQQSAASMAKVTRTSAADY
jgi:Trp operon repressor